VEDLRSLEKYAADMERINIRKTLVLSLFDAAIYEREDFERPGKLERLKGHLEKDGYAAEVRPDPEHNLFALSVRDMRKKGLEFTVDYEFCSQEDYREYYRIYGRVSPYYREEVSVLNKDGSLRAVSAEELLKFVSEKGKEGTTVQRYKGLGEMNPEQLWTTTMDPARRRLVRVAIEDAIEADRMFTILMGNNIESRKAFIQENAVDVRNLDI